MGTEGVRRWTAVMAAMAAATVEVQTEHSFPCTFSSASLRSSFSRGASTPLPLSFLREGRAEVRGERCWACLGR